VAEAVIKSDKAPGRGWLDLLKSSDIQLALGLISIILVMVVPLPPAAVASAPCVAATTPASPS
jgi:flagellar biosynthesis component FlhA